MKVSPNDATLAHSLAKHEIEKAHDRLNSGFGLKILGSRTVKEFAKWVDTLFRGRIIDSNIGRIVGSRASAGVVLADGDGNGNLTLVQLIFDAKRPFPYRVSAHVIPIVIQRHALARLMQRVVGESSLSKVITAIHPHLQETLAWVVKNNPLDPDVEVAIAGRGVELVGKVDEHGCLRLKTAINADGMQSATRQAWAMSEQVQLRVVYDPLTKRC
jgi:hypothetical protein